eukprot:12758446-Alexandrium_andersonii.AAC.1
MEKTPLTQWHAPHTKAHTCAPARTPCEENARPRPGALPSLALRPFEGNPVRLQGAVAQGSLRR